MTGTFYRDRQDEMLAAHRRQGHVLIPGTNLIDDRHLSELDWHIMHEAHVEEMDELRAYWRKTGQERRQAETRQYVDGVLARHRAEVERKHQLEVRRTKIRLRMALHEMDRTLAGR